jgi:hypothetical protein
VIVEEFVAFSGFLLAERVRTLIFRWSLIIITTWTLLVVLLHVSFVVLTVSSGDFVVDALSIEREREREKYFRCSTKSSTTTKKQ